MSFLRNKFQINTNYSKDTFDYLNTTVGDCLGLRTVQDLEMIKEDIFNVFCRYFKRWENLS